MPEQLELWYAVDSFGADAVFGRPMGMREIREIGLVRNIVNAYNGRNAYLDKNNVKNWAEWASKFPQGAQILETARECWNLENDRKSNDSS